MKIVVAAALAAGILVVTALAGFARPDAAPAQGASSARNAVTVTGTGSIHVVPDRAELSLGVAAHAETAEDALRANAERMRRVLEALDDAGIADGDVQTRELSLSPRYQRNEVVGYTASNVVSVSAKVSDAGRALDAAVAAGANQSYGLSLVASDRGEPYRRALADALADARAKAKALADAGGFDVGAVVRVEEQQHGPVFAGELRAVNDAAAATPIEAGRTKLEATVSVSFAIR